MKRILILTLLGACSFLSGCLTGCGPEGRQVKAIMDMTSQRRQEAFAKMTPEKQLEIYFYGQKYEPPLNFHFYIAGNWRSLLPIVKEHLASESDEKKLADLIALLSAISTTQCSLLDRKDVLDLASKVVAKLREDPYKGWATESLNMITHPIKQLPPCQ